MNALDILIMVTCLVILIFIGLISSRNTKSNDEFLTMNRSLNKVQASFSLVATDFGGSGLIGTIGYCYLFGLSGLWWNMAAAPALILVGIFLAKKLHGMNANTVPEYFGKRYSPTCRYIVAIMQLCTMMATLSVQFTICGAMIYTVTGIDQKVSLIIAMLVTLLLTSGGLRAVINTDVAQFVMIIISVIVCLVISLSFTGGLSKLTQIVGNEALRIDQIGFWKPFSWFFMCMIGYSTSQPHIQRMVSSKDATTARFSAFFTAGFHLIASFCLGLIGVAATVLLPHIADTNTVFPQLIISYFPHGFIGLGVVAVFAAAISTGTSLLHGLSIIFVNDIYEPLSKKHEDVHFLKVSKIIIFIMGICSLCLSLFFSNIIDVVYIAGLFYATAAFAPLIIGLNTKISGKTAALVAIIGSTVIALVWEIFVLGHGGITEIPSNFVGVTVGAMLMLLVGFVKRDKVI